MYGYCCRIIFNIASVNVPSYSLSPHASIIYNLLCKKVEDRVVTFRDLVKIKGIFFMFNDQSVPLWSV